MIIFRNIEIEYPYLSISYKANTPTYYSLYNVDTSKAGWVYCMGDPIHKWYVKDIKIIYGLTNAITKIGMFDNLMLRDQYTFNKIVYILELMIKFNNVHI